MPRVENCGPSVLKFCAESGNGSSTYDVCLACWQKLEKNPHAFDAVLRPFNGDPRGEDGWGGEADHPPYEECDDYRCEACGKRLTSRDN